MLIYIVTKALPTINGFEISETVENPKTIGIKGIDTGKFEISETVENPI